MVDTYKDNSLINDSVEKLKLNSKICAKLRYNEIDTIEKLCQHTRKELKSLDLVQEEIQTIIIKLQLQGLNIKDNEY